MKTVDEIRMEQLDGDFPIQMPQSHYAERYVAVNEGAKAFAKVVIENVPWSIDRDRAVQLIREAAMWAKDAMLTYKPPQEWSEEIVTEEGNMVRLRPVDSVD
jgi:hypothetical protein